MAGWRARRVPSSSPVTSPRGSPSPFSALFSSSFKSQEYNRDWRPAAAAAGTARSAAVRLAACNLLRPSTDPDPFPLLPPFLLLTSVCCFFPVTGALQSGRLTVALALTHLLACTLALRQTVGGGPQDLTPDSYSTHSLCLLVLSVDFGVVVV